MRRLYERLPDSVTVGGKKYRLDLGFRNVLKMMTVMENEDLLPDAKIWAALRCVMKKRPPKRCAAIFGAVISLLFGTDAKPGSGEKVTSFEQDADMIRAAMWQEYGVNLYRDDLHWFEFQALMYNLPSGSKYMEVLSIRTQEMPTPNKYNQKERERLIRAKAMYALKLTEDEQKRNYEKCLHRVFVSMSGMAEKG